MSEKQSRPEPLDYARRRPRRRLSRGIMVALLGAAIALTGATIFRGAHRITGSDFDSMVGEHARLHEMLWAAFGISIFLAGALLAAVGLGSWCRSDV